MSWFKRDLGAMLVVAAALTAVVGCGKTETAAEKADKKDAAGKKDGDKKEGDKKEGEKKEGENTPAAAAGAGSPEETFKAVKAALEKEDWKGFTTNLTPESRDMFAGMIGFAGVMMQAFAGLGGPEGAGVSIVGGKSALLVSGWRKGGDFGTYALGVDAMATQKQDRKTSLKSDAASLTDEQEAYAQLVFAKIKGTMEQDLLAMCRMMAARPDHELLGAGEFALRDMLNEAGAKVLEQAANVRAKKGVLG